MQSIILPPLGGQCLPRSPRPGSLLYVALGFASGYCWHMVLLPPFQALGPLTQMPPGAQEGGDSSVISRTFLSSSPFPFPHQEKNGGGGDMGPTPLFLQRNIFFHLSSVTKSVLEGDSTANPRTSFVRNKGFQAQVVPIAVAALFVSVLKNLVRLETPSKTNCGHLLVFCHSRVNRNWGWGSSFYIYLIQ